MPTPRSDNPRLSAVIAAYKEGESAPLMHERLPAVFTELGLDYEIIFVNSGSPDDTADVLAGIAAGDPHVTVINHTRAFGSQSAYSSGLELATGDAVVLLDGDLQDPPEMIAEFYARWREGYDVVYGERIQREAPWHLRFFYKRFYRVFQKMAYVDIPLDAGDFAMLDRRVVDAINALPEKHRFVRGLRAWVGFQQIGVPYVRPARMFGETSNSMLNNFGWARRAIVSFSYVPLDLTFWLAFITTSFALLAGVVEIILALAVPNPSPPGFATLIVVVLFVGGIQLLCLSVFGSYLAHIYEEVKARPAYIVDEVINPPRPRVHPATDLPDGPETAGARVTATEEVETPPPPRR